MSLMVLIRSVLYKLIFFRCSCIFCVDRVWTRQIAIDCKNTNPTSKNQAIKSVHQYIRCINILSHDMMLNSWWIFLRIFFEFSIYRYWTIFLSNSVYVTRFDVLKKSRKTASKLLVRQIFYRKPSKLCASIEFGSIWLTFINIFLQMNFVVLLLNCRWHFNIWMHEVH